MISATLLLLERIITHPSVQPSRGTRPCGGNPSLFAADSEEDYFSDSGSDGEGQAPPSLLPLDVRLVGSG